MHTNEGDNFSSCILHNKQQVLNSLLLNTNKIKYYHSPKRNKLATASYIERDFITMNQFLRTFTGYCTTSPDSTRFIHTSSLLSY